MRSIKELCHTVDKSYFGQLQPSSTRKIEAQELHEEEQNNYEFYKKAYECITLLLGIDYENNYDADEITCNVHTLSRDKLLAILTEAELEMRKVVYCKRITAEEQIALMTNYVELFVECTKRTTVPLSCWYACHEILETIFRPENEEEEVNERKEQITQNVVEHERGLLLHTLQERTAVCWWGTHIGLEAELLILNEYNLTSNICSGVTESSCNTTEPEEMKSTHTTVEAQQEVMEQTEAATLELKKTKTKATDALAQFTTMYFYLLNNCNAICHQYRHLFDVYGSIGSSERTILYTLLTSVSDRDKHDNSTSKIDEHEQEQKVNAIEGVIRQTFRRDFAVPSLYLCNNLLLEEYNDFEVNEKKQCEMEKMMANTLRQVECTQAIDLHNLLNECSISTNNNSSIINNGSSESNVEEQELENNVNESNAKIMEHIENDVRLHKLNEFNIKADALVQTYMTSTPPSCYLAALSFTFYRMLEMESWCNSTQVNLSRIEYVCSILHKWLMSYIAREHRWSVHDTFANQDDSDMWRFVLDRHSALLRIGVSNVKNVKPVTNAKEELQLLSLPQRLSAQINIIRQITFSVLHCWHKYLEFTNSSRANEVKKNMRVWSTLKLIRLWVKSELISVFGQSLLNDISGINNDNDDDADSIIGQKEEPRNLNECGVVNEGSLLNKDNYIENEKNNESELEMLTLEAELKLIICDVQLVLWSSSPSSLLQSTMEELDDEETEETKHRDLSEQILCTEKEDVAHEICNRLDSIIDACIAAITEITSGANAKALQTKHIEEISNACYCLQLVIRLLHQLERVYEIVRETIKQPTHNVQPTKGNNVNTAYKNEHQLNRCELETHILNLLGKYYRKVVNLASSLPFFQFASVNNDYRSTLSFLVELASDGWRRCIARQASETTRQRQTEILAKGKVKIAANVKGASFIDAVIERRKAMKRLNNNNHVNSWDNVCNMNNVANKFHANKRERSIDNNNNDDDDDDDLQ